MRGSPASERPIPFRSFHGSSVRDNLLEVNPTLAVVDSCGKGVRVVFEKCGDRWQHAIERVSGDDGTRTLVSVEGNAADDWPASPPFQELSRETLPDGRTVLFLVGRAGTSHWSASIEAASDPPQLIFDIACRHNQAPQQLGSAYARQTEGLALEPLLGESSRDAILPQTITKRLPGTTRWKYRVTDTPCD